MLHFAYGANMHRDIMHRHATAAQPIGVAALADHRFIITADGYASVAPALAQTVHGVLWRITPRDRVTLDAWENVAGKLYRAEMLPVRHAGRLRPALVYIARPSRAGPAEGGLYGACGRGGARLALAERLYFQVAALAAAPSGRRRLAQARRHRVDVMRHVVIRGRVQGIGYRAWTEYTALERGLQGWVRNRRDGSVEALFVGSPDAVAAMIAACHQGPRGSRVDGIDQRAGTAEELKLRPHGELFSVLPTA